MSLFFRTFVAASKASSIRSNFNKISYPSSITPSSKRFFAAAAQTQNNANQTQATPATTIKPKKVDLSGVEDVEPQDIAVMEALTLLRDAREANASDAARPSVKAPPQRVNKGFKPFAQRSSEEDLDIVREKMSFSTVATRFAFLLFESYKSDNQLGKLDSDIAKLQKEYEKDTELAKLIDDQFLSRTVKQERMDKFLDANPQSPNLDAFLRVLVRHGHLSQLSDIVSDLKELRKRVEKDVHLATIVSAEKLTDKDRNEIKKLISDKFKPDGPLELTELINPSIGGGFELFYEDKFHLDNTQRTRAEEISKEIEHAVTTFFSKTEEESRQELAEARKTG